MKKKPMSFVYRLKYLEGLKERTYLIPITKKTKRLRKLLGK